MPSIHAIIVCLLAGDWGQPYGSELFFVTKFATATILRAGDATGSSPPADGFSGFDWWTASSPPPPPSLYDNGYGYSNSFGSGGWYYDPNYGLTYGRRRLLSLLEEDAASGRDRCVRVRG